MARMNVTLDEKLLTELRLAIPRRQRGEFIEAAVREKLVRMGQIEAIAGTAGAWCEHRTGEMEEFIRGLRENWSNRPTRWSEDTDG